MELLYGNDIATHEQNIYYGETPYPYIHVYLCSFHFLNPQAALPYH